MSILSLFFYEKNQGFKYAPSNVLVMPHSFFFVKILGLHPQLCLPRSIPVFSPIFTKRTETSQTHLLSPLLLTGRDFSPFFQNQPILLIIFAILHFKIFFFENFDESQITIQTRLKHI